MSPRNRVVYSEFGPIEPEPETPALDLPPQQQKLTIQVSRKGRKGKTVTVISGFQTPAATLAQVLKTLKTAVGAGGTVKEMTLELQGDRAQQATTILRGMGYKL